MKALFLWIFACSIAWADCTVTQVAEGRKYVTCEASEYHAPSVHGHTHVYVSDRLPESAERMATREMIREQYKDAGGYRPGQHLIRGKGWYQWYKTSVP